ncbi:MAG: UDP-N-acetylmuramate dehydrogenase [Clostridiaceae bacterium]|nr:UDP-N-acetylmuramate dehydrogenase [Clostridiaceae bacterium]
MKSHTSFKIGGPADILVTPGSIPMLKEIVDLCRKEKIRYFIMGNGTNLLVRDKGIRGVVIKTAEKLKGFLVDDNCIEAEAGILLSELALIAMENELSGLEFAHGIPGTLGGAVTMNAGAYGGEMKDVVVKTLYMTRDGEIKTLENEQHGFGYRTSLIQEEKGIVLKSRVKLAGGDKEKIREKIEYLAEKRKQAQPLDMPSAGSIFKRPPGYYTGPLIDGCGLKGFRIGGAQVSMKHCGFIVNTGDASARDVIDVINHIKGTVKNKYGVELETEVKIVGEE